MGANEDMIKFIARVVMLGDDRFIINIPKSHHEKVEPLKGKQVFVTITEAIPPE